MATAIAGRLDFPMDIPPSRNWTSACATPGTEWGTGGGVCQLGGGAGVATFPSPPPSLLKGRGRTGPPPHAKALSPSGERVGRGGHAMSMPLPRPRGQTETHPEWCVRLVGQDDAESGAGQRDDCHHDNAQAD